RDDEQRRRRAEGSAPEQERGRPAAGEPGDPGAGREAAGVRRARGAGPGPGGEAVGRGWLVSGLRSRLARLSRALATRPQPSDSALERWRADPAALMRDAGFSPDPWQAEFLRSNDRMNLMLCARQVGKSLTVSILTLHAALTAPEQTVIVVAQRQDQASELL